MTKSLTNDQRSLHSPDAARVKPATTEHTQTPTVAVEAFDRMLLMRGDICVALSAKFDVVTDPEKIRDEFKFLETAVNSHDALVKALERAREVVEAETHGENSKCADAAIDMLDEIDAALRLAKGEA